MKIKINEFENYEINISDDKEISLQEASFIADRLSKIVKSVVKDEVIENKPLESTGRAKTTLWSKDRDKAVELLKIHYTKHVDEKREYARKNNILWNSLLNKVYYLVKKWNIKPEEVGIKDFISKELI